MAAKEHINNKKMHNNYKDVQTHRSLCVLLLCRFKSCPVVYEEIKMNFIFTSCNVINDKEIIIHYTYIALFMALKDAVKVIDT